MTLAARWCSGKLRLGIAGYLSCLAFSLAMVMFASGGHLLLACGVSLALAGAFYRAGLKALCRAWLWGMVAVLIVSSALLEGSADWVVLGLPLSWPGLASGVQMGSRVVAIVVTVSGFTASVSIGELASVLERCGLKGLGFALGVAFNMLPVVQDTATATYHALCLRGGFRRERLRAVRLLVVTIVVNSLRHVDDIVSAAEARAFSSDQSPIQPIQWQRGDLALGGFLLAATLGLLLI